MMTRGLPVRFGVLAAVASSVLLQLSCEQLPSGPGHASSTAIRGITLAEWSPDGYSAPEADGAIARIRSLGSTHVMLLTTAYQDTRSSSKVEVDSSLTPSLSSLWHAASAIAAQGLLLAVKTHVDVRDGTGRSSIEPEDPSQWFDSYRAFVLDPVGRVVEWSTDPAFIDTPGRSNSILADGRLVYVRSVARPTTTVLRVIPAFRSNALRALEQ